ncbi:hypothetical protein WG915_07385 [Corynebacterium sp. H128]|uniref:hypothetical protein n=1 Tax=Corynebacterium sp. H128 TaxID=3133427 RepID=UPI0030A9678D
MTSGFFCFRVFNCSYDMYGSDPSFRGQVNIPGVRFRPMGIEFPKVVDKAALALITYQDYWSREVAFRPEETFARLESGRPLEDSFRALLGRDKTWLFLLSSPTVAEETARQLIAALRWTIDSGFHELYARQLCAGLPVESGPRTELVTSFALDREESPVYKENLLADELFARELDTLLAWKKQQNYQAMEFPGGLDLNAVSNYVGERTSLPEPSARLLFSAVANGGLRTESKYEKADLKKTGLTPSQAATAQWFYEPDGLEPPRSLLLGLTWHPGYFRSGPNLDAFVEWWCHRYGPKWINLTNEQFWDYLTTAESAYGTYGEIAVVRSLLRSSGYQVDGSIRKLTSLLNIAMYVAPQSKEALEIADALARESIPSPDPFPDSPGSLMKKEMLENPLRKDPEATIVEVLEHTADFQDPKLSGTTKYLGTWGVQTGKIDEWFEWLRNGTDPQLTSRDPRLSAPEALAKIQQRFNLSEDAACYYLQIAVLTVPKDIWIRRWNDWSAARLKEASTELIDANLVIHEKRTNAGRTVFLPGRWHNRSDTGPAMEAPKLELYLAWKSVASRPLIEGAPPWKPLGLMFDEVAGYLVGAE